ncbi:hypothetical protein SCAB_44301 [Streptomyces scabiei 87.22]|uniref:Uncharacterized protein n=2 Tax=Streptomyces TaxID=1883 RepID=C9Z799_STRSW|nr:hypothetical protein SBD_5860 [Streptomyces bottropensis ATCC 25435]CBG71493.1 hypothetical protein SCAB_44301 [Streptomyces scabiei 87.22]
METTGVGTWRGGHAAPSMDTRRSISRTGIGTPNMLAGRK